MHSSMHLLSCMGRQSDTQGLQVCTVMPKGRDSSCAQDAWPGQTEERMTEGMVQ